MTHGFVLIVKNANNPEVYRVEVPPVTPVNTLNVVCCSLVHTRLTHTNTELPLTLIWTTPPVLLSSPFLSWGHVGVMEGVLQSKMLGDSWLCHVLNGLFISVPQCPHLYNEANNSSSLTGLW